MTTAILKVSRSVTIAEMSIDGFNPVKIAKELGISKRTVYRDLDTEQAKEIIDHAQKVIVLNSPARAERLVKLGASEDDNTALAAIKHADKLTGQAPSAIHNNYMQNVYNDNRQQLISPEVAKVLSGNQGCIIEAEVE